MICFTERKNKQVQYNMEQSYSLISNALYINNQWRLENLDVSSNVSRSWRWKVELCMLNATVLTGRLQTAHVHALQVPTSDTGTETCCICKQAFIFLLHIQLSMALLQTGFEVCALKGE